MRNYKTLTLSFLLTIMALCMNVNAQNIAPEPVSGKSLNNKIIKNHLIYPQKALENKIGGKILVSFTVGKDGMGKDFKVSKSFDEECTQEAIRLVKMIEWTPATEDSKPVEYQMDYTIDFSPKSYAKSESKNPRTMLPPQKYPVQISNKIYELKDLHTAPCFYFSVPQVNIGAYLKSELQYPDQAKQFEIQGTVKLNFIIETDGRASNIVVENSVGGGCDNEAIRLVQNLLWIPGVKDDSLVRSRSSQEITFKIGERNYYDGNAY